ncbi:MAG: electron transport protein, partial [Limisphaerales bacterium]
WEFSKAILQARRNGTNNLHVRAAHDATVGGRTFRKGEMIPTGLDVPKGALAPMGMKMRFNRGRIQSGITCAACHSAFDQETGKIVEGAPNKNINIGVLIALASNTAGLFANTGIESLEQFITENSATIQDSNGKQIRLPDPVKLEEHVDRIFMSWPPGYFDSTVDLVANPSQIPDSFTWRDHPYGWTGFAAVGPFLGLSVLNNNVHALNSDGLSQAEASMELFGFDKEYTYGIVLQNALRSRYRYNPFRENRRPSEFFNSVDPSPMAPGVNTMVKIPTFPKGSLISPDGLFISLPGYGVWKHNNAMSAFQNTLVPPPPPRGLDQKLVARGREIFQKADCASCHSGPNFTNNELIPAPEVGSDPARALANRNNVNTMVFPPQTWSWDTPVPIPDNAKVLVVPTNHLSAREFELAYAVGESPGGYKVKGLLGLYWSPPYLHDGGVAVGPDDRKDLGIPGTFESHISPDPINSLRAMVDRNLRARVIEANKASERMRLVNVSGIGHEHWVDEEAGFSREDQDALIEYLLSLEFQPETTPPEVPVGVADGN